MRMPLPDHTKEALVKLWRVQGALIKRHRRALGLSQTDVGMALGLTSGQMISNIERGKQGIPPEQATGLTDLLAFNPVELRLLCIKSVRIKEEGR